MECSQFSRLNFTGGKEFDISNLTGLQLANCMGAKIAHNLIVFDVQVFMIINFGRLSLD